ncbi:MAG: response regulator transcription factor [Verrucomicrobiota bacterium]
MTSTPSPSIVLVDDHPMVRTGMRISLEHHLPGSQIHEANNAAETRLHFATHQPDLVVLDVHLPGKNGLDLAAEIRAASPRTRILMFAADADPWTVNQAMKAGASGFVAKTNSAQLLPAAVDAVLAGQLYLCPQSRAALQNATDSPTAPPEPGPSALSPREREVLRCIAQGINTKSTAIQLQISPKTVETHRQNIMRKLAIDNVASLTRYAIRHNLMSP